MKKREVVLSEEERSWLYGKMQSSELKTQAFRRAQILVALDEHGNELEDKEIARVLGISNYTVYSTRRTYVEEGVERAVLRKVRKDKGEPLKVDGRVEAQIIAIACSKAPNELAKRTLQMIADEAVSLDVIDSLSKETVRQVLKKHAKTTPPKAMANTT